MTPEACTGLAVLLLELRDFLEDQRPDSLDLAMVEAVVDILAGLRRELVDGGAR